MAYTIDAVAHTPNPPGSFIINGVSDILSVGENKLLVIERSFSQAGWHAPLKYFLPICLQQIILKTFLL